jgi:hypothetical protein
MRPPFILNDENATIKQIRPELKLTEKEVEAPDLVNLIDREDVNKLSMLQQLGTYDQIGEGCKDVRDTMRVYLGQGMKYNTTSHNAVPLDPMSKLAYDKQREGGMIGSYNFEQNGNPLTSTYS